MSVAETTATLTGGAVDGGLRTYSGTLPTVTILSCQQQAWTVNGIASDFTSGTSPGAATFSSGRLGWTPSAGTTDIPGGTSAGPAVVPGPTATDGLKVSRVLGAAHNQNNVGSAQFGAALTLKVPGSTPPGTYASTLTLTALSGE